MAVYRFRVALEDNEDIYRDIEIKSTQTYEDLHVSILQAINFDNKHNASFFISDDYWRKGQEIALQHEKENEAGKKLMSKCKIAVFIDDPHQKILYVYDPATQWVFQLELLKILEDSKGEYPKCVKSIGIAPKQYKTTTPAVADDEVEGEILSDEKEPAFVTEEGYDVPDEAEDLLTEGDEGELTEGEEDFGASPAEDEHTEEL
jgi:hypothetical protein